MSTIVFRNIKVFITRERIFSENRKHGFFYYDIQYEEEEDTGYPLPSVLWSRTINVNHWGTLITRTVLANNAEENKCIELTEDECETINKIQSYATELPD
jgi:hypothetical protein